MEWVRILAYITGSVDEEPLLRNEYLTTENRILGARVKGRLLLSDAEKMTLADIGYRLGRRALGDVANTAKPETILRWYRKLIARKCYSSCLSTPAPLPSVTPSGPVL